MNALRARIAVPLLVAGVLACGEKAPPRPRPSPAPATQAAPSAAPVVAAAAATPTVEWTYTSIGKRDPFRSYLADPSIAPAHLAESRCTTPLGRFDLDQFRLVAVVTGLEDPVAMVEAPTGIGYSLRRGACIGRNGGVIAAVRTGEVVVSEWVVRVDGTRERAQTLLRLPKEAALNLEE